MRTFLLAAGATLALAGTAQAEPQTRYFDCGGDTPLTNLTAAPLTFSEEAPATAAPQGGCYTLLYQTQTAQFGGTYAGEVKKIDLDLYGAFSNPAYRQLLGVALDVSVAVDGKTVYAGDQLAGGNAEAGPLPGGFGWSVSIPELDIPATDTPKEFVITVGNPYSDDPYVLGRGAGDFPSAITFYAQDDLPEPEPEEGVEE